MYAILGPRIIWSNGLGGVSVRCESCGQGQSPEGGAARHELQDAKMRGIERTLHAAGRTVPYLHPETIGEEEGTRPDTAPGG